MPTNFKILELNNSLESMFCVLKENIIGKTIKQVYKDIDLKWIKACGMVALNGESKQWDIYVKMIDKHFNINVISPIKGQFIILFNDVTEIVKSNELLKKHFIMFENAKDILFYLKLDGSIIDANKTAVEKYGYTRVELLNNEITTIKASLYYERF